MKKMLIAVMDRLTTWFCSFGPLSFIGAWWWRRRLEHIHAFALVRARSQSSWSPPPESRRAA